MPGKQAFSNYLQGCQNLPVAQAFLNDRSSFQNSPTKKAFVSHWWLMSYKNTSVTDAEIVNGLNKATVEREWYAVH